MDTSPEAIAALLDGVTDGPWWGDELDGVLTAQNDPYHIVAECFGSPDDVLFCAEARQLVPALAAENAALKAEVARLREALQAEHDYWKRFADLQLASQESLVEAFGHRVPLRTTEAMARADALATTLKGQTDE